MSVGGGNADLIDSTLWRVTPSDHPASRPNSSAEKTSTFQAKRPCKLKRRIETETEKKIGARLTRKAFVSHTLFEE